MSSGMCCIIREKKYWKILIIMSSSDLKSFIIINILKNKIMISCFTQLLVFCGNWFSSDCVWWISNRTFGYHDCNHAPIFTKRVSKHQNSGGNTWHCLIFLISHSLYCTNCVWSFINALRVAFPAHPATVVLNLHLSSLFIDSKSQIVLVPSSRRVTLRVLPVWSVWYVRLSW